MLAPPWGLRRDESATTGGVRGTSPASSWPTYRSLKPGRGEVLIALRAAALNRRRNPWVWTTPDYCQLPVTLGSDGAGVVAAVGLDVRWPVVENRRIDPARLRGGARARSIQPRHSTSSADRSTGRSRSGSSCPRPTSLPSQRRLSWEEAERSIWVGSRLGGPSLRAPARQPEGRFSPGAGSGVVDVRGADRGGQMFRVYVTSSTEEKLAGAFARGGRRGQLRGSRLARAAA